MGLDDNCYFALYVGEGSSDDTLSGANCPPDGQ